VRDKTIPQQKPFDRGDRPYDSVVIGAEEAYQW
jgi:hypothetical protein